MTELENCNIVVDLTTSNIPVATDSKKINLVIRTKSQTQTQEDIDPDIQLALVYAPNIYKHMRKEEERQKVPLLYLTAM